MNTKQTEALKLALKLALAWVADTAKYMPTTYDRKGMALYAILKEALAEQPAKCKHNVFAPYRCTQCEAEQPASNVNATGGPKAFFSLAEQPAQQQEPVAFDVVCHDCGGDGFDRQDSNYRCTVCNGAGFIEKMLYTSPPASKPWVGLTDEEIDKTHETQVWDARRSYARAIEAKLREKNT